MTEREIIQTIAREMGITAGQVERTAHLLDEGNTIPFISRYRKEVTGRLDEDQLRQLEERLHYLRNLARRKEDVLRLIDEQGKLTSELEDKIKKASVLQEVEDLYRPYRPKRQTRATKARERGLEPLAARLFAQEEEFSPLQAAEEFVDSEKEVPDADKALQGARDIIAEWVTDDPAARQAAREMNWERGFLCSEGKSEENTVYDMYRNYREKVKAIPPHRVLAMIRGEKEEALKVYLEGPEADILRWLENKNSLKNDLPCSQQVKMAIEDGFYRLLQPAMEREIKNTLWERAEEHAMGIFATNLHNLLMQPPLRDRIIMGIDPGYRTGSKVVVVDNTGRLLDTETIYPHAPQNKWDMARRLLVEMASEQHVQVIAIGNGTACRETEKLVVEVIGEVGEELKYIVVDEAGASVYSASKEARQEFPELDVSMRGAVSIARRLQDPLAELVKIDPRSLGVGMYQHDVTPARLKEKLEQVVESCVNQVGVDVNTASPALLGYVAGLNSRVARSLVDLRDEEGPFSSRQEIKEVKGLGVKTFEQAAGFLRLYSKQDPLARTPIHPESYHIAEELLEMKGFSPGDLEDREKLQELQEKMADIDTEAMAEKLGAGVPTLEDILEALKKPGRDPRESLPKPIFRTNVLSIEDLQEGMVLEGTVRNVVDFGAFVDIGVKEDGLVHISQLSQKYVKNPLEVVTVGDIVKVMVKKVDIERGRISLTMNIEEQ